MELNDELLCAYLDEELDAAQRAQLEQALERDSGGRLRLERMRVADARLRADIPLRPLDADDPLARRILESQTSAASPPIRAPRSRFFNGGFALAAGLCGLALGMMLTRVESDPGFGNLVPPGDLRAALEGAPSGSADASRPSVVLTVAANDGRVCRQFRLQAKGGVSEGIACREAGKWRVLAWEGAATESESYRPAGGSVLLDGVLDRLGGKALALAEERALIEKRWEESN